MKIKPKRYYLHIGANGTYVFNRKIENDYYSPTHLLKCVPTKRKRVTHKLKIGAICNLATDGHANPILLRIVQIKPLTGYEPDET